VTIEVGEKKGTLSMGEEGGRYLVLGKENRVRIALTNPRKGENKDVCSFSYEGRKEKITFSKGKTLET